jgi:hypothetical protein
MRQRGIPFCAGLAARTRPVTWPAAYALPFGCPPPGRMRMRCSFNPLLHVAGISWSLGGSLVANNESQRLQGATALTAENRERSIVQGIRS